MAKSKKRKIELKGTKIQKICLLLQIIVLVLLIASTIYVDVNNIETGFFVEFSDYGLYIIIFLLLFPNFFPDKKK